MGKGLTISKKHSSVLGYKRYGEVLSTKKPMGNSILGCRKYYTDEKNHRGAIIDGVVKKSTK